MFKLRNKITPNTSFNDSSNEEFLSLLQLAVSNAIQTVLTLIRHFEIRVNLARSFSYFKSNLIKQPI